MNLGPLTTAWTAPLSCLSQSNTYLSGPTTGPYYLVYGPLNLRGCYPDGYGAVTTQFYSPGVCPSGYTVACRNFNSVGSSTETIHTCCPAKMDFTCLTGAIDWSWQSTLGCTTRITANLTMSLTQLSSGSTAILSDWTERANGGIGAYSIQVRFQPADFATSTSSSASTAGQSTAHSTSALPSETGGLGPPKEGEGGLSAGAAAAIGVGSAIAVIALIFLVFCLFYRRRKRRNAAALDHPDAYPYRSPQYQTRQSDPRQYGEWQAVSHVTVEAEAPMPIDHTKSQELHGGGMHGYRTPPAELGDTRALPIGTLPNGAEREVSMR